MKVNLYYINSTKMKENNKLHHQNTMFVDCKLNENAMTFAVRIIELIVEKIVMLELFKHLFDLLLYLLIPNRGIITH